MDSVPGGKIKEEPHSDPEDEAMRDVEMSRNQEDPDSDEDVLLPPADVLVPKIEFFEEEVNEESGLNQSHSGQEQIGASPKLECNGHFLAEVPGKAPSPYLYASRICEKDVAEKIQTGEYIVVRKERSRSKVWERFASIYDADRKRYMGYVQCTICGILLTMKLGSGTTHLSRHVCKKDGLSGAMSVNVSVKVSDELTESCLKKCIEMCVRDLVPSSTVSGTGFRNLCQELVKIGAAHGNVNVLRLLPSADTILKHVSSLAAHLRESLLPDIRKAVLDGLCVMDIWTERVQDTNHAVVTSHYISDDWKICRHLLLSFEFPHEETFDNQYTLRKFLQLKSSSIDLPAEIMKKLMYVTSDPYDYYSESLDAFHFNNSHILCAASYIRATIRKTFADNEIEYLWPEIWACVHAGKLIMHYLINNGLQEQLNVMIQQSLPSCWNYSLFVLEIVFSNYETIHHIFTEKMEIATLRHWNRQLMSEIVPFLMKFKEVIIELQNHTYPTLHLVLVHYFELKNLCTPSASDHPETVKMKLEILGSLLKYKIVKEHYIATFLCPHTRLLKQLDATTKGQVHQHVRNMCAVISGATQNASCPQPAKKSRFGSWNQYEEDDGTSLDEVHLYLATGKQESEDPSDLLSWWLEKAKTFPKLSQIARKVLCIPATCSPYGQFSNFNAMLAVKDKCFAYDQLNDLLFIRNKIMANISQEQVESNVEEKKSH
ncbi:hypothetical protein R5R35_008998 [Gryllus longicercus]|uniref:BED-type domain-containing protein n=1 Tax=Gryllus longicercus TaxID=2509291 RepID=A0AAN9Z4G8_9ORTH